MSNFTSHVETSTEYIFFWSTRSVYNLETNTWINVKLAVYVYVMLQIFGTFNSSVRIRRVQGRGQNIRLRLKKPHIVLKTVLWDLRQKPDFSLRTEGFKAHGGSEDRRPADEFHSAASVLSAASSLHLLCFTFMLFSFSEQTRRVTHRSSLFVLLTGQIKATFHLWRWLQLREITSTGRRKHNGSCSQSQDS